MRNRIIQKSSILALLAWNLSILSAPLFVSYNLPQPSLPNFCSGAQGSYQAGFLFASTNTGGQQCSSGSNPAVNALVGYTDSNCNHSCSNTFPGGTATFNSTGNPSCGAEITWTQNNFNQCLSDYISNLRSASSTFPTSNGTTVVAGNRMVTYRTSSATYSTTITNGLCSSFVNAGVQYNFSTCGRDALMANTITCCYLPAGTEGNSSLCVGITP